MLDKKEFLDTLETFAKIPAPSGMEDKRVEFCLEWFLKNNIKAYADEAKNVIVPFGNIDGDGITVFLGHTDVVFPDTEPLPYYDDGEKIHAPGIADNTVHAAQLMFVARELARDGITPKNGILIVLNSCEEGLGNLKGIRQIMKDFDGRIRCVISVDGGYNHIVDKVVGSERWHVTVKTEGGHSFGAFGNSNAIEKLSNIIRDLYAVEIPKKENTKTTFNVGTISGGTSVNTIAQDAEMLFEYRSDDSECLKKMRENFEAVINKHKSLGVEIETEVIGIRPCGEGYDEAEFENLLTCLSKICEDVSGIPCKRTSSSTDSNIPLSMGVLSTTIGGSLAHGAHTREEWVDKESIFTGYEIVKRSVYEFTEA